jgi:hypothetical protein
MSMRLNDYKQNPEYLVVTEKGKKSPPGRNKNSESTVEYCKILPLETQKPCKIQI